MFVITTNLTLVHYGWSLKSKLDLPCSHIIKLYFCVYYVNISTCDFNDKKPVDFDENEWDFPGLIQSSGFNENAV